MSRRKRSGRDAVFAQGALKKRLVSRTQAEECLAIARKLRKRGKKVRIENVFVRKGYLRKAEAQSIAKRLKPAGEEKQLALAVAEPEEAYSCPNCGKDPGDGDDCFRCGADLETGGPGPDATVCESCGKVVKLDFAICPSCARPIRRRRRRRGQTRVGTWLNRLVVLTTLVCMAYFLVYRNLVVVEGEGVGPPRAYLEEAHQALEQGDREKAVKILEEGLEAEETAEDPEQKASFLRALALVAPPARAREAAEALEEPDGQVDLRLSRLSLNEKQYEQAVKHLDHVPANKRDDAWYRLRAKVEKARGGDWVAPHLKVRVLTPVEKRQLALELVARGRKARVSNRREDAQRDLVRAVELNSRLSSSRVALGMLRLDQNRNGEALRLFERAVQLEPLGPAGHLGRGLALERTGVPARARGPYQAFLKLAAGEEAQKARIALVRERLAKLPK